MKLTLEEARLLLGQGTHTCPVNGALDRILAHDGAFDPCGENIHFLLRHYSEQNHVLYGGLHNYRKVSFYSYHPSPVSECCVLCAARITSLPYFTALNGGTRRWEVCRDCHAAVHGLAPSFFHPFLRSSLPFALASMVVLSVPFPVSVPAFVAQLRQQMNGPSLEVRP